MSMSKQRMRSKVCCETHAPLFTMCGEKMNYRDKGALHFVI